MKKLKKKEIRLVVDKAIAGALEKLHIANTSKKTKKVLKKASKKVTGRLKGEVKTLVKKTKPAKAHKGKQSKVADTKQAEIAA
jgi:hypothetical protein